VVTGFGAPAATASVPVETAVQPQEPATLPEITEEQADTSDDRPAEAGPWGKPAVAASTAPDVVEMEMEPAVPAEKAGKRDIETALGTRWAVWVGGIALALGGLFLVRYTIEAGIFGPGARLSMAGLF